MTEHRIPTEQELDMLLEQSPAFHVDVVKQMTISRIGIQGKTQRRKLPLRRILVAAVICALSVSAVATAEYMSGGYISKAFGIQRTQTIEQTPEQTRKDITQAEDAEKRAPENSVKPTVEETVKPHPELDEQIAEALKTAPEQKEVLRPAVQNVEQSVETQDVRMTVLQTLGDPDCLYIKLRFDFPRAVSATSEAEFDNVSFVLDQSQAYSWSERVLERDTHSITYLICVKNGDESDLNGQTATIRFENFGQPVEVQEGSAQFELKEGQTRTIIVMPNGDINGDASAEEVAALLPIATTSVKEEENGFTVLHMKDGTQVVTYDGSCGTQYVTVLPDEKEPVILTGDDPWFKSLLKGSWEKSWQLSYTDTSLYWKGSETVRASAAVMTEFRISPLSWHALLTYPEVPVDLPDQWNAQLLFKDGTTRELPLKASRMFTTETAYPCTVVESHVFETPLELTDVTAILLDGREFPLR